MTEDYVNAKAREALKATHGDKHDAQKLLITWAIRDQQLLLGLAKPHIKALAAARIDRLTKRTRASAASASTASAAKTSSRVGKEEKRKTSKVAPPKASQQHISVMHKLAAAFKKK